MSPFSENEIKIFRAVGDWVSLYICPVCIIDPKCGKSDFVHMAATGSLINTGDRKILITNHHVIQEFLNLKEQKGDVVMRVESLFWNLADYKSHLIDSDRALDLAVFSVGPMDFEKHGKQFCLVNEWPPKRAVMDESVIMIGFPGKFRHRIAIDVVKFEMVPIIELVTTVTENQFSIKLDRAHWAKLYGHRESSEFTDLGGYSGSAVFRPRMVNNIMVLEPMGIIYESSETLDINFIRHIDFINSDGTIRKPVIPL